MEKLEKVMMHDRFEIFKTGKYLAVIALTILVLYVIQSPFYLKH